MFTPELTAKLQKYSTPFYYYDLALLRQTLAALKSAASPHGYRVHYALKANFDARLLGIIREHGLGADCVSGNEVQKALDCGFPAGEIVFAGVGKSDPEIMLGLQNGIRCFNCESLQELEVIDGLAGQAGRTAPVALRINPDVDAHTHQYITTGREENKFGIYYSELAEMVAKVQQFPHLKLEGIHFHIGSQITDIAVFQRLSRRVNEIQRWFREREIALPLLNLGGGLGIDYQHPDARPVPDFAAYFNTFAEYLELPAGQEVHFELGRALVGQCGSLISRVLYIKQGRKTRFAILDAGMTELIRPALYQAHHQIDNITSRDEALTYDVVGPVCETADFFAKGAMLPQTRRGDLIAVRSAGAYGAVMASRYNLRPEVGVVYSDDVG